MSGVARAVERAWTTGRARQIASAAPGAGARGGRLRRGRGGCATPSTTRGWLAVARVPARVMSVGNLTVGGTGKTPTALWLAERAVGARAARRPSSRAATGSDGVASSWSGTGGTPLVSPDDGGDEAVMLARRFRGPGAHRRATRRRRARAACARFGVDTIVLDDGFQHRALARDADLVLLADDAAARRLLPAGSAA